MKKYLLPLLMVGTAYAQTSAPTSTTEVDLSLWDRVKDKIFVNYFIEFYGPSVANPTDTRRIDANGDYRDGSPMNSWNQIGLNYRINESVLFIINPRFEQYYGRRTDGDGNVLSNTQGLNPVIGVNIRHKFTDNLMISANINTNLANVQKGTQDEGLLFNPGGFHTILYKLNDKFSLGQWISHRINFYDNEESNDNLPRHSWWLAPFLEYSLNDTTFLRGFISQAYVHNAERSLGDVISDGTTLGLGFDTGVNEHFGIFPFIAMDWTDEMNTRSASIGAWIYGRVF